MGNKEIVVWKDRHGTLKFNGKFFREDGIWPDTYRIIIKISNLGLSRDGEQYVQMQRTVKLHDV